MNFFQSTMYEIKYFLKNEDKLSENKILSYFDVDDIAWLLVHYK